MVSIGETMKTLLLVILSLSISLPSFAKMSTDAKTRNSSNWNQLVDSFFDDFYALNPTQATAAGFHQHDSELEDYSRKGIENQIALANKYLTRLDAFDTKSLSSRSEERRVGKEGREWSGSAI